MRIAIGILQVLDWAASFATPLTVLVMLGKFLERREGWLRLVLRYAAAWVMCNNVIYFGDYVNILYALPAVFLLGAAAALELRKYLRQSEESIWNYTSTV